MSGRSFAERLDDVFWRINWMIYYRVFLGVPWRIALWVWRATRYVLRLTNWIPVLVLRLACWKPIRCRLGGRVGRALLLLAAGGRVVTVGAERLERWAWRAVDSLGVEA